MRPILDLIRALKKTVAEKSMRIVKRQQRVGRAPQKIRLVLITKKKMGNFLVVRMWTISTTTTAMTLKEIYVL